MNQGPNYHFSVIASTKSPADFERISTRFRALFDKQAGNGVRSVAQVKDSQVYTFQVTSNMIIEALPMRIFVNEIIEDKKVALIYHHSNCPMEEPLDLGPNWTAVAPEPSRLYLVSVSADYSFNLFSGWGSKKLQAFSRDIRSLLGFDDFFTYDEDDRSCAGGINNSDRSVTFYVEYLTEVPQGLKDEISTLIQKYTPGISVVAILEN